MDSFALYKMRKISVFPSGASPRVNYPYYTKKRPTLQEEKNAKNTFGKISYIY
jgi:hypothetical protein